MALTIVDLKNPEQIAQIGAEYVCTGFMFDVSETNKDFEQQLASFDFVSVSSRPDLGRDLDYEEIEQAFTGGGGGY